MNGIVRNVLLPWYNAYRFLVQNVARLESTSNERLRPNEVGCAVYASLMCPCPLRDGPGQSQAPVERAESIGHSGTCFADCKQCAHA